MAVGTSLGMAVLNSFIHAETPPGSAVLGTLLLGGKGAGASHGSFFTCPTPSLASSI